MYAIAHIKGFQYKVQKGDTLRVPKYDMEIGKKLSISEVMLVADGADVAVGTPYVENAVVKATVSGHDRYDKITVLKKKRRKDYSVKRGHRQDYTELVIDDIVVGAPKKATKAAPKKDETPKKDAPAAPAKDVEEKVEAKAAPAAKKADDKPVKKAASTAKKTASATKKKAAAPAKKASPAKKTAAKKTKDEKPADGSGSE